ncbi:ankyrin repeat domain-containing protein [Devosia sp.]|uniref:ankyrin repeat domain-containing protein n=1 Tax=Devosia sp. TaxID=1871048 RepID=UPI002F01B415
MANPFDLLAPGRLDELRAALAAQPAAAAVRNAAGTSLLAQAVYVRNGEAVALIRAALPELAPHEAVMLGDAAAVRAALARGWDLNALAPDGFTPLGLAAFFRQPEIFALLLPLTSDVNQRARNPQQVAALHAATAARDIAMVEQLLRAGADPGLPQAGGVLPLHAAALHGDAAIVGLLLLFGAAPMAADDRSRTAVDFAREGGHPWLAARLAALAEGQPGPPPERREDQLSP